MGAYGVQQAAGIQGNPYAAAYAGRSGAQAAHQFQQQVPAQPGAQPGNLYSSYQPTRTVPVHPDVKLVKLPFYDISAELLKPASLLAQGGNRFHESQFQFFLTPSQATDIASNRDIQVGTRMDYLYQVIFQNNSFDELAEYVRCSTRSFNSFTCYFIIYQLDTNEVLPIVS